MGKVMCFENDGCQCFMLPKFPIYLGLEEKY